MTQKYSKNILKGTKILVIDDDTFSLDLARRILTHYGAIVELAKNGLDGLAIAQQAKPDLIISDLSMPEMDGWTFMDCVQRDNSLTGVPVIALTAHAVSGDRQRAIDAGFFNYITKPISPAAFINDLMSRLVDLPPFKFNL